METDETPRVENDGERTAEGEGGTAVDGEAHSPRMDAGGELTEGLKHLAPYMAVVHRMATEDDAVIEKLGGTYAIIRNRGLIESYVVVIRNDPAADEFLRHFIRTKFGHARTVILVGGETSTEQKRMKKLKPFMTSSHVGLVHVDDNGGFWSSRARAVMKVLEQAPLTTPTQEDLRAVEMRSEEQREQVESRQGEAREFVDVLKARKPFATYGLIGLIAVFFGMEAAFGGVESIPVLARMGAHIHDRMTDHDEWYRGLSVALLHRGYLHGFFNAYVLFVLGSLLERVLGTQRFLILFVTAAAGGALATFLRDDVPISVGASGAVWGILVAQAILAWFGRGVLPDAMLAPARRAATFNLVANVFVSTLPSVDWTAHLGGGLVGAALVGSGLLTAGLPRTHDADSTPSTPAWIRPAAVFLTVALVSSGVFAVWNGRAWELRSTATERIDVPAAQVSIVLAANLSSAPKMVSDLKDREVVLRFGNNYLDAEIGAVVVGRLMTEAEAAAIPLKTRVRQATEDLERLTVDNMSPLTGVEPVELDGKIGVFRKWEFPTGVTRTEATLLSDRETVHVQLYQWPELGTTTAMDIARSVRRLGTPSAPNGAQATDVTKARPATP